MIPFVPSTGNIAIYLWDFLDDSDAAMVLKSDRHRPLTRCTPRPDTAESTMQTPLHCRVSTPIEVYVWIQECYGYRFAI